MPKKSKNLCVDDLRHAEYYGNSDTLEVVEGIPSLSSK